jgi:hypothetical protein
MEAVGFESYFESVPVICLFAVGANVFQGDMVNGTLCQHVKLEQDAMEMVLKAQGAITKMFCQLFFLDPGGNHIIHKCRAGDRYWDAE